MRRIEEYINAEWLFDYGEHASVEQTYEFDGFYNIGLPHSFTTPYYGGSEFYVGYGVYAKTLSIPQEYIGRRIILEFGAVFQVASVYLNGELVATHKGGYTAFVVDISSKAKVGDNILVVRVDNNWSAVIAPRAGEHTFCGGIYRDVKLIVTDNSYIDWYGVFVTTPQVSKASASVVIYTDTVNCIGKTLFSRIYSQSGEVVAEIEQVITADKTITDIQLLFPTLWSIDKPYLYTLESRVGDDQLDTTFGVRYFEWNKDKGFFLNGEHVLIQGANVHQDHGGWGDAVTHSGILRDVKMMKDCGMNFIRGSHYPHHIVFGDECDRQGMLFWSESVFWGIGGFQDEGYWDCSAMPTRREDYQEFENSLVATLTDMIKTNRNHPSIIAWSMGNEIFFSKREVMQDAKALVARMVDLAHSLDPTRPSGIGGVQREGFDQIGDIAGYNGDGAVLFKNPKLPSLVAEYGSVPSYRPGEYSLNLTKGADDFYDFRAGRAIWCGFHHGSIASIGNLGIVDLYRLPLKAWYCYREKYKNIPPPKFAKAGVPTALKITADKTNMTCDGLDDCMLIIESVDESGERVSADIAVTLEVVSGGAILPTGRIMTFDSEHKSFFDGACAIECRAYLSGKTTLRATSKGLASASITLTGSGDKAYNGEIIVMPHEPPVAKRPLNVGVDIVANRPVVVSSEELEGMRKHVSDGDNKTYWSPSASDTKPLITLDLENLYENFKVSVELARRSGGSVILSGSIDNQEWTLLTVIPISWLSKRCVFDIYSSGEYDNKYRYLRFEFSNFKKLAVKRIKAWRY